MTAYAVPAIEFRCEKCRCRNWTYDTLELVFENGEHLRVDNIDCDKCGHTNHVIMREDIGDV